MTVHALMLQTGGGQIEEIARTFGVDWPHLSAQIISFSIVCALLYWFAYKPVLRMLGERRQQIAQGVATNEKIKAALADVEAHRQRVMAEAQAEAARVIAEGRAIAKQVQEREAQRAVTIAEQIVAKAHDAAERERARMLVDLRGEMGRLITLTTAAVTGKILTPDDQRRLAEETARQLTS
jgi:F-type H+-transporting ATPase subunit b